MKYFFISIFSLTLFLTGCDIQEPHHHFYHDYDPPSPPSNIIAINGDSRVDISWAFSREDDVEGYNIYFSYYYDGKYTLIGNTTSNYFIDRKAVNGNKYYYAVTAYDYSGNESELSYDVVYSAPRPEGFNNSIFDYRRFPANAGYSFSDYQVVPYDDLEADIFFENYQGSYYLNVWDDSDIQDMGYTGSIYDVVEAPAAGWSPTKDAAAKVGHTYVIWTWDNHFAKIRIKNITRDRIVFDWAYQLIEGEPQLKPVNGERKNLVKDLARE